MLSEILSKDTCAGCKICCSFDVTDIWETPIISAELKERILLKLPEQKFISRGQSFLFRMGKNENDDLFYCPMLSEIGCILGDEKPFDCKIWPFRIMNFHGSRVITVSPVCDAVFNKPISELVSFLKSGTAKVIFKQAELTPDIIKDYISGYPILMVE